MAPSRSRWLPAFRGGLVRTVVGMAGRKRVGKWRLGRLRRLLSRRMPFAPRELTLDLGPICFSGGASGPTRSSRSRSRLIAVGSSLDVPCRSRFSIARNENVPSRVDLACSSRGLMRGLVGSGSETTSVLPILDRIESGARSEGCRERRLVGSSIERAGACARDNAAPRSSS